MQNWGGVEVGCGGCCFREQNAGFSHKGRDGVDDDDDDDDDPMAS